MSGFTGEWLALREPADIAARSQELTSFVRDALESRARLEIVDLGSGTGSNVRYLAPRLPSPQHWTLIDDDPALLALARQTAGGATVGRPINPVPDISIVCADLADIDRLIPEHCDLVTASALLDLVSARWLAALVDVCRRRNAAVLAVLDYDGRIACEPVVPGDERLRDLVNRHQRTDKGFGPALGPEAGEHIEALLRTAGYDVRRATSGWVLADAHLRLQRQLIAGWASAARAIDAADARIAEWEAQRLALVDSGRSRITVGHVDVAGILRTPDRRSRG
jgi:SAM-dependent methyltransferase